MRDRSDGAIVFTASDLDQKFPLKTLISQSDIKLKYEKKNVGEN